MKFQTLFLYLLDVYCTWYLVCFNSNQTIFKLKTEEKPKTEKVRGIQGFYLLHLIVNSIERVASVLRPKRFVVR